ncbi:MAG: ATP-binding protein [Gammaproteobacteria bacterium]
MMSLQTRLLLAASLVLLTFVGLCGAGLESSFRRAALDAQQNRMRGIVYALLGAAEPNDRGTLELNDGDLPEPRLMQPDSGLEAAVYDETGKVLWRSPSQAGALPLVIGPEVGRWKLERIGDAGRFALSFGLRWIVTVDSRPQRYTMLVLEEPGDYEEQLGTFRRTLWLWLAAAAAGLLAALVMVLRWGLRPMRRLVRELNGIEAGTQGQIDAPYPQELTPLAGALNAMIRHERSQLQRYRNALGDLAHSLKTPLAVLRGLSSDTRLERDAQRQLDEQVGRMQQIADHQLSRAATAGRRALAQPVAVQPVAAKLAAALKKVYADKSLAFELEVSLRLQSRVDSGDLHELLGNTLDNAAKWARTRVRLHAGRSGSALELAVEDDGPGFPSEPERLLERGVRADDRVPGQGLGLAAVAEILRAYEGEIVLERSAALGGARVVLRIPAV